MDKHTVALFLVGAGAASLLFSLFRTYYLMRKLKREREAKTHFQEKITRHNTDNDKD